LILRPRVDSRRHFVILFFALVAMAWLALVAWGQSPYGRYLTHQSLDDARDSLLLIPAFLAGWLLMIVAMMLPTSLPLVNLFRRLTGRRGNQALLLGLLLGGYTAAWLAFGVGVFGADWLLHEVVHRSAWVESHSWMLGGSALLVAGVYQFTPLKYMCLDKCRSPFGFINQHWHGKRPRLESLTLGLHHGAFCIGCCWSLMLLMFAVGVGSLGWMLALALAMAVEKNMPWGKRLSLPLGATLVAAGIAVLVLWPPRTPAPL